MKAIYLDCFSGISGNMLLGAFIQAGLPAEYLLSEIKKLITEEEFSIKISDVSKNGIVAPYVEVKVKGAPRHFRASIDDIYGKKDSHSHDGSLVEHTQLHESAGHTHVHDGVHTHAREAAGHPHLHESAEHEHRHDGIHPHAHGATGHAHSHESAEHEHVHDDVHTHAHVTTYHQHSHESAVHEHVHDSVHPHAHRTMASIREMITGSTLSAKVKETSLRIFSVLAEAEGKVHGVPSDDVHFHEVGATDSIVDIVGTAVALDYFDVERVFVSRVNTGSGYVECAHGTMMVPAPATAELLTGFPFYHAGDEKEMTTPTGAAVIRALADFSENLPDGFAHEKIAYGAGYWDLSIPNVLRMYLGEYQGRRESDLTILETNIDDMNPQDYGHVYDQLFSAGALDVWTTPIFMKKNRPAVKLSVLTDGTRRDECARIIFRETTSIGMRIMPVLGRVEAARRVAVVSTPYGEVACKISAHDGHIVSLSAEYEDCKRLAEEHKVPVKKVRMAALTELGRRLGE